MPRPAPVAGQWTRRGFLAAASLPLAAQRPNGTRLPSERKDFRDRVTEAIFTRVTAPTCSAWLPAPQNRAFARRARFLLHASDRSGSPQAWTMDLKSGDLRLVSSATQLDPASLSLTPDEKSFCYVELAGAPALMLTSLGGKPVKLADLPNHAPGSGIAVSNDGQSALLASGQRLLRVPLRRGAPSVLIAADALRDPRFHPTRPEIAYFQGPNLMTATLGGGKPTPVPVPEGRILDAHWPPNLDRDSSSLLYLHASGESGRTVNLREYDLIARRDKLVSLTSQYACFSPNSDASVFAGASFSRAQPYVLMLVRSVAREMTLVEHASPAAAARVAPVFTPDSRQLFWSSEREGKPAIYSMVVDKLVEATEEEESPKP